MTEGNVNKTVDELTHEQWLQVRKEEGRKIDPDTAEVWWNWAEISDAYFVRSPGSDNWVSFYDLPDKTRRRLRERHESESAFWAGLER